MIMDQQLLFSDSQAVTATANSTNVIDLGIARDIGVGENLWIFLLVTESFTDSSSDSTITPSIVTDDNASLTSTATIRTLPVLAALTAAGTIRFYKLEPGSYERYLALTYTVANGSLSTGKITAGIVHDIEKYTSYTSGYSVS